MVETQLRKFNQAKANYEHQSQIYSNLEVLVSEPGELGLSNYITSFFNSWDELSLNPKSTPLRTNVINQGQLLSNRFNEIYNGFNRVKEELNSEANAMVVQINSLVERISNLNRTAYDMKTRGVSTNDILDERDALVLELSELANINVNIDDKDAANVSLGGMLVADMHHSAKIKLVNESGKLVIKDENGAVNLSVNSGKLGAILNSHSTIIPDYLQKLDSMAIALVDNVNAIHKTGYTLEEPPETGIDFFSEYNPGQLSISDDILKNTNLVSVSKDGSDGNNQIAIKLAELKNTKLVNGKSLLELYSSLITDLGAEKNLVDQNMEAYGLVVEELDNQKSSFSGVSIDEEMMNVLKFQRSYDASAKLIKVADELMQTLLGVV